MGKEEREKRRERLKIFANNNQWMRKRDLEQKVEEISAQLREYRRDLQQIRMQEAATEAKIEQLQLQVSAIEESLHQKKDTPREEAVTTVRISSVYDKLELDREGYSVSYGENGLEREGHKSTVSMYA